MNAVVAPFHGWRWLDIPVWLLVFYVGFSASMVLHELGHYFAARALGITPDWVRAGHFGPAVAFRYDGTAFTFRLFANPLADAVTSFGEIRATRLGISVILLAGVAVNLAVGAGLLWAGVAFQSAPLLILALASAGMGLGQIIPVGGTDGGVLLRVLRL